MIVVEEIDEEVDHSLMRIGRLEKLGFLCLIQIQIVANHSNDNLQDRKCVSEILKLYVERSTGEHFSLRYIVQGITGESRLPYAVQAE